MHSQTITSIFTDDPSNDFTVHLVKPIAITDETSLVYVEDIIIDNNWYNINKYNKTIKIKESVAGTVGDVSITLTEGFYSTKNELADHLETVFNSELNGTVTVTYSSITNKFTITNTNFWLFDFLSLNDASKVLGYGDSEINIGFLQTHISTKVVVLNNSWIYLKFYFNDSNVNNLFTDNQTMSIMIPITSGNGNPIVYKPDTPKLIQELNVSDNISTIRAVLYDQYLNPLQNDEGAVLINFQFN